MQDFTESDFYAFLGNLVIVWAGKRRDIRKTLSEVVQIYISPIKNKINIFLFEGSGGTSGRISQHRIHVKKMRA